jgi:predicted ArsR family transcriptional regulator
MEKNNMAKLQIKEVNCTTGDEIVRDATAEELAQIEFDAADAKARKAEADAKANTKSALLDRLGITAEEAQLLLS